MDMSEDVTSCKVTDLSEPGFSLTIEPCCLFMGTDTERREVGLGGRRERGRGMLSITLSTGHNFTIMSLF